MIRITKHEKTIGLVLRIAVFGEFLGHGVFALQQKAGWVSYFTAVGIGEEQALTLMTLIGIMDVTLAILVLVHPWRPALLWMALWGMWTALLRPIAGEPIWDFFERWANWGAPLALLLLLGWPRTWRAWWSCK